MAAFLAGLSSHGEHRTEHRPRGNTTRRNCSGIWNDAWSTGSHHWNAAGWTDWSSWNPPTWAPAPWQARSAWGSTEEGPPARPKPDTSDPPAWPGWEHYRLWKRWTMKWDKDTDVPLRRRAEKILTKFSWDLQSRFQHYSDEELSDEKYLTRVFQVLDSLAGEKEDDERKRVYRAAMYETVRARDETLAQFVSRRELQFHKARSHGFTLPDDARGLMLEEGSGLSAQGRQNLRTLTGGSTTWDRVASALRNLDIQEERILPTTPTANTWLGEGVAGTGGGAEADDEF